MSIIYEDRHLQVLYINRGGKILLVTFGNMLNRANSINIYAGIIAEKLHISILGFMPKDANWYPSSSIYSSLNTIYDILNSYPVKVGYGGSMGGYGCLKYSKLLTLNKVIALDSQFSININDIDDNTYYKYYNPDLHQDMKINEMDISKECKYYVAYDPFYSTDVKHVFKINQVINDLNIINISFSFHSSENIIADTSTIKYLLLEDIELSVIKSKIRYLKRNKPFHISHLLKKIYLNRNNRFFYLLKYSKFNFKNIELSIREKAIRQLIIEGGGIEQLLKLSSGINVMQSWLRTVHGQVLCYNLLVNRLETYSEDIIENQLTKDIKPIIYPILSDDGYLEIDINGIYYFICVKDDEYYLFNKNNKIHSNVLFPVKISTELGVYIKCGDKFLTPLKDGSISNKTEKLDRWEYFKPFEKFLIYSLKV